MQDSIASLQSASFADLKNDEYFLKLMALWFLTEGEVHREAIKLSLTIVKSTSLSTVELFTLVTGAGATAECNIGESFAWSIYPAIFIFQLSMHDYAFLTLL